MTQSRVVKEGIWYTVQRRKLDTDSWLQQQGPWETVTRGDSDGEPTEWMTRDLNTAIRYAKEFATEKREIVWSSH